MARKASMKVTNANSHSTAHNKRKDSPSYLLHKSDYENEYKQLYSDKVFRMTAEEDYNRTHKRRMQQRQKDALIKETVINLEQHHALEDVENLFKELNQKFGGHYAIDFSLHNDEGHYEDENGITYRMGTHIKKIDNEYYIVPIEKFLEKDFKPKKSDYTQKVNLDDFKIVYNKHCHVKFSMYDLDNHKTGRMTKGDITKRLKFSAEYLNLEYKPEEKISSNKKVRTIIDEHDIARRADIRTLLLSEKIDEKDTQIAKHEEVKKEVSELRKQMREANKKSEEQIFFKQDYDRVNALLKQRDLTITELKEQVEDQKKINEEKEQKLNDKNATIDSRNESISRLNNKIQNLAKQVINRDSTIDERNESILELEQKIADTQKELEQEIAKVKDVNAQYKAERQRLIDSKRATQQDYQKLKKQYDELKDRAKAKDLTISKLQEQLNNNVTTIDEMKQELEDEKAELAAERAKPPKTVTKEIPVEKRVEVEVENTERIEQLKKELADERAKPPKEVEKIVEKEVKIEDTAKIDELERKLEDEKSFHLQTKQNAENRINAWKEQNAQLKREKKRSFGNMFSQQSERAAELERENERLKRRLQTKEDDWKAWNEQQVKTIRELKDTVKKLKNELQEQKSSSDDAEHRELTEAEFEAECEAHGPIKNVDGFTEVLEEHVTSSTDRERR